MKTLRLILGDQLNLNHQWFSKPNQDVSYVMMEIRSETDYCRHHIQKVVSFFLAMRNMAEVLRDRGHQVIYYDILHPDNQQSFAANIKQLILTHHVEKFEYQLPDEYRVDQELNNLIRDIRIPAEPFDTGHFFTTRYELKDMFASSKTYLMETFYRAMRRKHQILMQAAKPVGGQWNFDKENRKKLPKQAVVPQPFSVSNDAEAICRDLEKVGVVTMGSMQNQSIPWPVTREQALASLDYFCRYLLPEFGTYQDAMSVKSTTLYHSCLSFALNVKLISPLEVIERVIGEWEQHPESITLAQVEGYVRQVLGWREFMRGVYWARMPQYASMNYFNHRRSLPQWYWNGQTKMNCLHHAIKQSLQTGYAHHIQRLMLTGNFALLAGIEPSETDAWYLGIYIDAIEWVEITNTRGMSQFADGGLLATKPYVSSANYIDKMSDYCGSCFYKPKQKTGEGACPFNALYWHFYNRHREQLQSNPRIGMMYKVWDGMEMQEQEKICAQAEHYLNSIEQL